MESDNDIADALNKVANAIHKLGLADAVTPMGAIEAHGVAVKDAAATIAAALGDLAEAIREGSTS